MAVNTVTLVDSAGRVISTTDNGDGTATLTTSGGGGGTAPSVKVLDTGGTNTLAVSAGGAAKVDGSAVTQPVSAAALPLPTGAATAAKQPALGTAGSASTDVVTVQGIASGTAQPISGTVTANAGTNLNTSALALDATLTGGTQKAQLTDGTNVANVLKSDGTSAGQNSQLVAGGHLTVPFTTTTAQAVGSTDAANFAWVAVHITSQGGSSTVTFQSCNDNSSWVSSGLSPSGTFVNSSTTTGIWYGAAVGRYFRLNVTGIASGTTAGTIEFFASPRLSTVIQASQLGTWTVQPGNTANTTAWLVNHVATAVPVAFTVSAAIAASAKDYRGFTIRETAGSTAVVVLYDNASAASGTILEEIALSANESAREFYPNGGVKTTNGIYLSVVSGTVAGSVRTGP